MCWMCVEQSASSYRKCDGCKETFDKKDLQIYDVEIEWGQLIEWIEYESASKRFLTFCANCRDAMNAYRESTRQQARENEPYIWHHYGNRCIDKTRNGIPVAINCLADQQTLGLRCAKEVHGYNAVEEMLRGIVYHDDLGHQVKCLTLQDVDERTRCDKCWLPLWRCNSLEVTR